MPTNELRMPLAEWLFRMSEDEVPYQARSLAIYAVLFKVVANDELAILCGMDTKGLADKTYNKWKKLLADDGWLLLKSATIGRLTSIEIFPAIRTKPVTFTDVAPRDPSRFGKIKSYGREVETTSESYVPTVIITEPPVKVTAAMVEITDGIKTSPAPTRAEDNININNNLPIKTHTTNNTLDAARDFDGLQKELVGACNGALDNPVNCQGLLNLGIPIMWMNEGCDLQQDILPTLRAFGQSHHGKRIKSWAYFSGAMAKARDARMQGLPAPSAAAAIQKRSPKQIPLEAGESFSSVTREFLEKIKRGET